MCTEGPERIRELIAMGASFDHGEDGNLHLAREGGHSHRRIVHAADMTGREIERALLEAVLNDPNISVFKHHFAIDLLTSQVSLHDTLENIILSVINLAYQIILFYFFHVKQDGLNTVCHGVDTLNIKTDEVQKDLVSFGLIIGLVA